MNIYKRIDMAKEVIKCPHCGCDSFGILRDPEDGNNAECVLCGCRYPLPLLTEEGGLKSVSPVVFLQMADSWSASRADYAYVGGVIDMLHVLKALRRSDPALDTALGRFDFSKVEEMDR